MAGEDPSPFVRVMGDRKDDPHRIFGFTLSALVASAVIAINVVSLTTNGFWPA